MGREKTTYKLKYIKLLFLESYLKNSYYGR